MIEVKNLTKKFDDKIILDNISVTFEQGKTNLIIGQSGSGKTVLLKSIVGLHTVDQGEIWYDNRQYNALNFKQKKEIRKEIGMLFQGGALFDSSTVQENVMLPLDMFTEMNFTDKLDRVNFCLQRVNLSDVNNLYPSELSGGMKKRVAIARAIALNPRYLFCDEPNSGLDPQTGIVIDNLIKNITDEFNITTIVNTHDMNSVMEIGDKVVFIFEGKKIWEGSNNDILHTDCKELNDFVFATNLAKKLRN
jgi:phospholipid/cholesterol/gamma-HCH transport system ATP-binding protein